MSDKPVIYSPTDPVPRIITICGQKVILDSDLARIYGVETKALNQAVKRNRERFPSDFVFQLALQEVADLTSQIAISSSEGMRSQFVTASEKRNVRFLPYAFTEHGAIMAATVLNSPRAVQMSVFVVRAFIRMRAALADNRDLARKLAALEKEIKSRLDVHESAIVDTLRRLMEIIDQPVLPDPPKKQIGFQVKEKRAVYCASRRVLPPSSRPPGESGLRWAKKGRSEESRLCRVIKGRRA